jgi:UDP-glucose 4-epimerase
VISIFTRRALSNIPPIIYGDGQQTRDYTYIKDAVKAYDLVLKRDEPLDGPINFGSGKEITIAELADTIIEMCGKKGDIEPVHVAARPGEVNRLIANASKAKSLLGWQPEYDFREGLKEFIDWYKCYGFEEAIKLD